MCALNFVSPIHSIEKSVVCRAAISIELVCMVSAHPPMHTCMHERPYDCMIKLSGVKWSPATEVAMYNAAQLC